MELPRVLSSRIVRVVVTSLVLVILAMSIEVRETLAALAGAKIPWLVLAILTILVIRAIMAVRWWLILSAYGFSVGIWETAKVILVTSSLGNVLPIGFGQDLLRGYHVARTRGRLSDVSATIIVDRALGTLSMAFVAVAAAILGAETLRRTPALVTGVVLALAVLSGFGVAYLLRDAIRRWSRSWSTVVPTRARVPLQRLVDSLFGVSLENKTVGSILLLSVLVQIARSAAFIFIYAALGVSTNSLYYFVTIPLVFMVALLPVSLGGLGIREGALVVFFRDVGFSPEVSVAAGLIFFCLQLIALLPGLVLFLFGKGRNESRAVG